MRTINHCGKLRAYLIQAKDLEMIILNSRTQRPFDVAELTIIEDLPRDATYAGMEACAEWQGILVYVYSQEFEVVPSYERVPIHNANLNKITIELPEGLIDETSL